MELNLGAARVVERMQAATERLGVTADCPRDSGLLIDCGIDSVGGLEAGRLLAEACLAGLGDVSLHPHSLTGQSVVVRTDHPVAACLGAQYAGWAISPPDQKKYFAMGSGPMRAAAGVEPIIEELGLAESVGDDDQVVGVLETSQKPTPEVYAHIADRCQAAPSQLVLLTAPTASVAGTIQVVARSVETALHKMHEVGFPLETVRAGFGAAPLPPIAADDLQGIGWTNDAILYGGEVTLWVDCEDDVIESLGPRIPSSASPDHGSPFAEIFRRYEGDFYKIDPLLFSPAVVSLQNCRTARRFCFGQTDLPLLRSSFQLPESGS